MTGPLVSTGTFSMALKTKVKVEKYWEKFAGVLRVKVPFSRNFTGVLREENEDHIFRH